MGCKVVDPTGYQLVARAVAECRKAAEAITTAVDEGSANNSNPSSRNSLILRTWAGAEELNVMAGATLPNLDTYRRNVRCPTRIPKS